MAISLTAGKLGFQDAFIPFDEDRRRNNRSQKKKMKVSSFRQPNMARLCGPPPWAKKDYSYDIIGLHEEINDFYEYMCPTPQESELRMCVVRYVSNVVHSLWPYAKLEVFGSYRTGLYLPLSDIDLVISGQWRSLPLITLSNALLRTGIQKEDMFIISNTSVPIIRFIHNITKVKVDISFNQPNGVDTAKLIKRFVKTYPLLPKLIYVLKQFLVIRDLNEVFTGGMRSYCLMVMVVSFLQGYHKPEQLPSTNLGTLLLEFFELYGVNFNYSKIKISFKGMKAYFQPGNARIEDPLVKDNNLLGGTDWKHIQSAFENAYHTLHAAVTVGFHIEGPRTTVLQQILSVERQTLERRHFIHMRFPMMRERFQGIFAETHPENQSIPSNTRYHKPPSAAASSQLCKNEKYK